MEPYLSISMKITNPDTAAYLETHMPGWYSRITSDKGYNSFMGMDDWVDDLGQTYDMGSLTNCILGELHNFSGAWFLCCDGCAHWNMNYLHNHGEAGMNDGLDKLVAHFKECHPVPKIMIPIEVKA